MKYLSATRQQRILHNSVVKSDEVTCVCLSVFFYTVSSEPFVWMCRVEMWIVTDTNQPNIQNEHFDGKPFVNVWSLEMNWSIDWMLNNLHMQWHRTQKTEKCFPIRNRKCQRHGNTFEKVKPTNCCATEMIDVCIIDSIRVLHEYSLIWKCSDRCKTTSQNGNVMSVKRSNEWMGEKSLWNGKKCWLGHDAINRTTTGRFHRKASTSNSFFFYQLLFATFCYPHFYQCLM